MADYIRVESVDALRRLRTAVVKFIDTARSAIIDADMELQHVMHWVQNEQAGYWKARSQKCQEAVAQARQALRDKKLFRSTVSSSQDTVDEEKALARANRALAEAEQKFAATVRWARRLPQDSVQYNGVVNRLTNQVENRLPESIAKLDQMAAAIEAYLALQAPAGTTAKAAAGEDSAESMSRGLEAATGSTGQIPADSDPTQSRENELKADKPAAGGDEKP